MAARPATSESMRAHWADAVVRARRKDGVHRRRRIRFLEGVIRRNWRASEFAERFIVELEELRGPEHVDNFLRELRER